MAIFQAAVPFVLDNEDALWRDPARRGKVTVDAGGRTRFGIAERFHPNLPDSFYTGDAATALVIAQDLLESEYWNPLRLAEVNDQGVATKIFDMSVDMGKSEAARLAQEAAAMKEASAAGTHIVGDLTIKSLNAASPEVLMQRLVMVLRIFYNKLVAQQPQDARELDGWLARADRIPAAAPAPAATEGAS